MTEDIVFEKEGMPVLHLHVSYFEDKTLRFKCIGIADDIDVPPFEKKLDIPATQVATSVTAKIKAIREEFGDKLDSVRRHVNLDPDLSEHFIQDAATLIVRKDNVEVLRFRKDEEMGAYVYESRAPRVFYVGKKSFDLQTIEEQYRYILGSVIDIEVVVDSECRHFSIMKDGVLLAMIYPSFKKFMTGVVEIDTQFVSTEEEGVRKEHCSLAVPSAKGVLEGGKPLSMEELYERIIQRGIDLIEVET